VARDVHHHQSISGEPRFDYSKMREVRFEETTRLPTSVDALAYALPVHPSVERELGFRTDVSPAVDQV
jgi:hypothetical protein